MTTVPSPPNRPSADDALVVQASDGNTDALETLLRKVDGDVRQRLSIAPHHRRSLEIDDVMQVTYLEAFLRIRSFSGSTRAAFVSWMRRIAENNLRDAVRALERAKRPDARHRITQGAGGESTRTLLAAITGHGASPGTRAGVREDIEQLRDAIARLPRRYRTVVEGLDLAERPVSDVAGELACSNGAVHMLRARALDRLAELLDPTSES